jgi:hypothetical protein
MRRPRMAIRVFCDKPRTLLADIKAAIENEEVITWKVDSDGDFTHTPEQWRNRAWFRARIFDDRIVFNIIGSKTKTLSREVYAVYHGRFVEMLLSHFDKEFERVSATALAAAGDIVTPTD